MSHDQRLHPATDQDLLSVDDSSYPQYTIREDEGFKEPFQLYDVESYPDDSTNDLARLHTAPPHTSNDSPWSHINTHPIGHSATVTNRETPGFVPLYSHHDPPRIRAEDLLHALDRTLEGNDVWGEASEATIHPYEFSTWNHLSLPNAHRGKRRAHRDRYATQIENQEHQWPFYVGVQSNQPYPELMDGSVVERGNISLRELEYDHGVPEAGVLVTPDSAQQLDENEDSTYEPSGGTELHCAAEGCTTIFRGRYRKGNLARHKRHYHSGPRVYICEDEGCDRVFRRQDARIKHYRKYHPHLTSGPAFSRKSHRFQSDYDIGSNTRETGAAILGSQSSMPLLQYADSGIVYMDITPSKPTIVTSEPSTEALRKDGESVRCDICQKEFNRAAELRRHNDSVHNLNPPQYFCEVPGCDRASRPFPRKDKLADHTARVHGHSTTSETFKHGEEVSEATYRCDHEGCEREFDQRADLLRHQRTHTDKSERPHKCAQCEKSFLYPKDLKRHQATHLDNRDDEKPSFHCQVASCEYGPGGKGFSRKDGMIRHMGRFHPELVVEKEET